MPQNNCYAYDANNLQCQHCHQNTELKTFNARAFMLECQSFYRTFLDIEPHMLFVKENFLDGTCSVNDIEENGLYEFSYVVNGAFAAELALKYLLSLADISFSTGNKGHDLLYLYNLLFLNKQSIALDRSNIVSLLSNNDKSPQNEETIKKNIESWSDCYNRFRYCVSYLNAGYEKAETLAVQIADKQAEIAALEKEMKRHSVFFKGKQAEIQSRLTAAINDLKELEFARNQALRWLDLPDGATDLSPAAKKIEECRSDIVRFGEQEDKFRKGFDETLGAYRETLQNAASLDREKLYKERLAIREKKEDEAWDKLTESTGYVDESEFNRSIDRVSELIGEKAPHYKTEEEIRQEREYEKYVRRQAELLSGSSSPKIDDGGSKATRNKDAR